MKKLKVIQLLCLSGFLSVLLSGCWAGIIADVSPTPVPPTGFITVQNFTPTDGSIVTLDTTMQIQFSAAINPASLGSITISNSTGNDVPVTSAAQGSDSAVVTPQANFAANTMYTVSVTGVTGANGETMEQAYESTFWTPVLNTFQETAATGGFSAGLPDGNDKTIGTGYKMVAGNKKAITTIYDDSGAPTNEVEKDIPGYNSTEVSKASFKDGVINEIVAATAGINTDYYVVQYNESDLSEKSSNMIAGLGGIVRMGEVTSDSQGNAIACGSELTEAGMRGFFAKCSAAGCTVQKTSWAELGGIYSYDGCALDASDNIYIAGKDSQENLSATVSVVAKYNSALVVQSYAATSAGINLHAIDLDGSNLIVSGTYYSAATVHDLYLARVDPATLAISQSVTANAQFKNAAAEGIDNVVNIFNAVSISDQGIFATGSMATNAAGTTAEAYTAKYDSSLNLLTSFASQSAAPTFDEGISIVADTAGGRVLTTVAYDNAASSGVITSDINLNCAAGPCG